MQIFPHPDLAEVLHRDRHDRLAPYAVAQRHVDGAAPPRRAGGSAGASRRFRRREG